MFEVDMDTQASHTIDIPAGTIFDEAMLAPDGINDPMNSGNISRRQTTANFVPSTGYR